LSKDRSSRREGSADRCGATRYACCSVQQRRLLQDLDALTGMRRRLSQIRRLKVMRPAAETPPVGGGSGSSPVTPSLINNALTTSCDSRCARRGRASFIADVCAGRCRCSGVRPHRPPNPLDLLTQSPPLVWGSCGHQIRGVCTRDRRRPYRHGAVSFERCACIRGSLSELRLLFRRALEPFASQDITDQGCGGHGRHRQRRTRWHASCCSASPPSCR
jgi:hypothetical protein